MVRSRPRVSSPAALTGGNTTMLRWQYHLEIGREMADMSESHVTELYSSPEYLPAEKWADQCAGDNETHLVVIEDFRREQFIVMDDDDAAAYLAATDSEVQYDVDRTPEWFARNA